MSQIREFGTKLWKLFAGDNPAPESDDSSTAIAKRSIALRSGTSRWISFLILLAIIVAMGILFYRVMASFFLPLFMALLLTVMFRPVHMWFMRRFGGYRQLSAALTTAIVLLIVLVPLAWAATLAVKEGMQLASNVDVDDIETRMEGLRKTLGLNLKPAEELGRIDAILTELLDADESISIEYQHSLLTEAQATLREFRSGLTDLETGRLTISLGVLEAVLNPEPDRLVPRSELGDALFHVEQLKQTIAGGPINAWLTQQANPSEEQVRMWRHQALDFARQHFAAATGTTTEFLGKFLLGVAIMIVGLYFFLADGEVLLSLLTNLSPLDEVYERELLLEFDRVSRAVVLATILSALVQAILAGFGFWVVGIDAVFLLMMLTFVLAMIPFVGAAAVWVPVSLYLWLYNDQIGAAIFLAIYGATIVSLSDNVIKPLVLHGQSKLHPLLALLSILGGVQALGPLGIFIGPMVVAFLQTLLKLLHREIMALDASEANGESSQAEAAGETKIAEE